MQSKDQIRKKETAVIVTKKANVTELSDEEIDVDETQDVAA